MSRRALLLLLPLALGAAVLPAPATTAAPLPTRYVLPGQDVFPEGVTAVDGTFYVTSTTTGAVFRGRLGDARTRVFLPGGRDGRTTAVGLEVTPDGDRLVVAGGSTGQVFVYDTSDGSLIAKYSNGGDATSTFLNDVAFDAAGNAYVTDSVSPVLYRIPAAQIASGTGRSRTLRPFVQFSGTVFSYVDGFNANGIVVTEDGRYALVVQSQTGRLFRIGLADKSVRRVQLGSSALKNGDGLELDGRTLYAVRNANGLIVKLRLAEDALSAILVSNSSDASLRYPTTAALARGRLLVVNSQFDQQGGDPEQPFTVSSLPRP